MVSERPKIKDDLQVQAQTVEGVSYYVVKEPAGGKFIRLREPEYFLLNSLHGQHTSTTLAEEFIRTYNLQISAEAIDKFVEQLRKLGFLEGDDAATAPAGKSVLFIKLKAFNPERLLAWLYPKTKWLFAAPAVVAQVLLIVLGAFVFFANIAQFPFNLNRLLSASGIVTIIVSVFLLVTFHEFAHALACIRYGGKVREMGFLLLYFQPCFYCNLSDAYLFKRRRERIIVNLVGIFFQMVIWALFAILWRYTREGYFLNQVFYLTAAVSFATLLFNLNPAIKLDGYYLLADYLQIPNLRRKAFAHIGGRLKSQIFGCKHEDLIPPSPREAKIYRRYGTIAILYSILLIGFVLYRGGELLIGAWQGTGFVLFLLAGLLIFHRPIRKSGSIILSIWQERKSVWMRPKRILAYLVVIAVVVLLAVFVRVNLTTGGPARLYAAQSFIVRKLGPGTLEISHFRGGTVDKRNSELIQLTSSDPSVTRLVPLATVGDTIAAGDTLLVIRSTLNDGLLAEAGSALKKAEAERRLLLSDPKLEEIDSKKSDVKQAEAVYESARREFNRVKQMHEKQIISDEEFEKSSADFNVAYEGWQSKKNELQLLMSAPKAEEIEKTDADIDRLKARVAYLQYQENASSIVSPFTGVLVGTQDGNEIFHLASLDSLMVEIELPESDLDVLSPGTSMELRVAAFPSRAIPGTVLKLKMTPKLTAIATVANDGSLLPEMNGYAKVDCGRTSIAALLYRKLTRFFELEVWSWT